MQDQGRHMVADLSIRTLARAYRDRSLSPIEVLDACLKRLHALNPRLNALVTVTEETARQAAVLAEQQFSSAPDEAPGLCGIPFSVKDKIGRASCRERV